MLMDSKIAYDLQLALNSIKKTPVLSALMVAAVGVGIGACMTIIAIYYLMSTDPNPDNSEQLYTYALDNHLTVEEGQGDGKPRLMSSYRDALYILQSDIPTEQSVHYPSWAVFQNLEGGVAPFWDMFRLATPGFFSLFDVPFLYGEAWSQEQEDSKAMVIVLTRGTNNILFGGENSVGEKIEVGDYFYEIVGVMDSFEPLPKYFEFDNGIF